MMREFINGIVLVLCMSSPMLLAMGMQSVKAPKPWPRETHRGYVADVTPVQFIGMVGGPRKEFVFQLQNEDGVSDITPIMFADDATFRRCEQFQTVPVAITAVRVYRGVREFLLVESVEQVR